MKIRDWFYEVDKNNSYLEERQKELGWVSWKCATGILDSRTRKIKNALNGLSDMILDNYSIKLLNKLQKENYGNTYDEVILYNDAKSIIITFHDFTQIWKYNVYCGKKHIFECEEENDLMVWINHYLQ